MIHRAIGLTSLTAVLIALALLIGCDQGSGAKSSGDGATTDSGGETVTSGDGDASAAAEDDPTASPEALMAYVKELIDPNPPNATRYYELFVWENEKQEMWRQYIYNFSVPHSTYAAAVKETFGAPPGISKNIRVARFDTYSVTENDGERAKVACSHAGRDFDYYLVNTDDGWRISGDTFENDEKYAFQKPEFELLVLSMPGFSRYITWMEQRVRDGEFSSLEEVEYEYRAAIRQYYDDTRGEPPVLGRPQSPPTEPAGPALPGG